MKIPHLFRLLQRSPGFSIASICTLGLGIGISTVVFTIYDAIAFKPIGAKAPGELVRIAGSQNERALETFSFDRYREIAAHTGQLRDVIATSAPQTLGARVPEDVILRARFVSANYFDALGVVAARGRSLRPDDRNAAVISDEFWRGRLNSDPAALSRQLRLANVTLDIVGIAPPDFAGTGLPPQMPDVWIPLAAQPEAMPGNDWQRTASAELQLLGRRRSGASNAQVTAELSSIAASWPLVNRKPARLAAQSATFFQVDSGEFSSFQAICAVLAVAVGLILVIGSINLINLLFASHARREREFAVRLAMGSGRWRLIRQLCLENLSVGALGGGFGLLLSLWACVGVRALVASALSSATANAIGFYLNIDPDWRVFAYAAVLAIAASLTIAVWPAIRASRCDLATSLKEGTGGSFGGHRRIWSLRSLLISAQVAGCLTLLASAGLLFRGVWRSASADPGFETAHLALAALNVKSLAETPAARTQMVKQTVDRVRALPEVAGVAVVDHPPFLGHWSGAFDTDSKKNVRALVNLVSPEYFDTMGVRLVAGRTFTQAEAESGAAVAVIDEAAAENAWPHENPIGKVVRGVDWIRRQTPHESVAVIGVARNAHNTYLSKADPGYLYEPLEPPSHFATLLIRTRTSPKTAFHSITGALESVNPGLPSQTYLIGMDQAPLAFQRLMTEAPAWTAVILGSLALTLAAVGVFGLVAQLVAQRTREIAIRVSLGAQNADVTRLVIGQTIRPVMLGTAFGLAGAAATSALLAASLRAPDMPDLTYGAGAFDAPSLVVSLGALSLMVGLACLAPMRRALRVAPAAALRDE